MLQLYGVFLRSNQTLLTPRTANMPNNFEMHFQYPLYYNDFAYPRAFFYFMNTWKKNYVKPQWKTGKLVNHNTKAKVKFKMMNKDVSWPWTASVVDNIAFLISPINGPNKFNFLKLAILVLSQAKNIDKWRARTSGNLAIS